ncbi:MAG: hypothetical protein HC840_04230, partial [Leptolyngbyaceae cyanobacterium RM2_2_4]|nr:hypothetical protein [Leptolyngbyaceae cyanobacterium RM2_2_4]
MTIYLTKRTIEQCQVIEQLPTLDARRRQTALEQCQIIEKSPKLGDRHHQSALEQCQIIELPKITDHRGNLTFIE